MIYSNKEIFEKDIKNDQIKKILEFLDSKGVIILEVEKDKIKFLSTDKNIYTILVENNSSFLCIGFDNTYNPLYIYNDEKSLELLINGRYDSITIGRLCNTSNIKFKSYEDYCKLNKILSFDKYLLYNIQNMRNYNTYIIIKLYKIKNMLHQNDNDEYKYLVFSNDNFDDYEEYDNELPEKYSKSDFIVATNIDTIFTMKGA